MGLHIWDDRGIASPPLGLSGGRRTAPVEGRRVHLDTWAIMEVLTEGKHADRVESILRRSGPGSYSLVTSQVSLGEAAAVILRRGPGAERMLKGMIALLSDCRVEPGRCMPPLDAGVLDVVQDLARTAPRLDMTDRVVLAHALADPDSSFLITKDRKILSNSTKVGRYEKKARMQGLRNTRLRIVDPTETYPAF